MYLVMHVCTYEYILPPSLHLSLPPNLPSLPPPRPSWMTNLSRHIVFVFSPRHQTRLDVAPSQSVFSTMEAEAAGMTETGDLPVEGIIFNVALGMASVESRVGGSGDSDANTTFRRLMYATDSITPGNLGKYLSADLQDLGLCVPSTTPQRVEQAGLCFWDVELRDGVVSPNGHLDTTLLAVCSSLAHTNAVGMLSSLEFRGVCTFVQRYLRKSVQTLHLLSQVATVEGLPINIIQQLEDVHGEPTDEQGATPTALLEQIERWGDLDMVLDPIGGVEEEAVGDVWPALTEAMEDVRDRHVYSTRFPVTRQGFDFFVERLIVASNP